MGAAYRLGNATVLRAAYGVYYSLVPIPIGVTLASNPPLFVNSLVSNNQTDFAGARSLTDGPVRSTDPNTPGQSYTGIAPDFRTPYVQQWNVAVQRQLPGEQQVDGCLRGNQGHAADVGRRPARGLELQPGRARRRRRESAPALAERRRRQHLTKAISIPPIIRSRRRW